MKRLKTPTATAKDLLHQLHWYTGGMHRNVIAPGWTPRGWWEMDLCRITKSKTPSIWEYETKVSWPDFMADFNKRQDFYVHLDTGRQWLPGMGFTRRTDRVNLGKHEILMNVDGLIDRGFCVPHFFSFVVCPSICEKAEAFLKEKHPLYGLYSFVENRHGHRFFEEIIKPGRLKTKEHDSHEDWADRLKWIQNKSLFNMSCRYWDFKITELGMSPKIEWKVGLTEAQRIAEEMCPGDNYVI